jgi:hypothetical protein
MDVIIRSLSVAARRRHAAEKPGGTATFAGQEKRSDLAKAIAGAAAVAGTNIIMGLTAVEPCPVSCAWSTFLEKWLSELSSARTAVLVLLYADSFGSSATAYGLTRL